MTLLNRVARISAPAPANPAIFPKSGSGGICVPKSGATLLLKVYDAAPFHCLVILTCVIYFASEQLIEHSM